MIARVKILIPLFLMLISLSALSQDALLVLGKMKLEQGRLEGKMEILKDGKRVRIVNMSGSGKFDQELKLDANYLFVFSQEGYVTKKIEINTTVNGTRIAEDEPYQIPFQVTLFKQYEGVNFVIFNQPVAKIHYNANIDDFDYDTDYTKSIQERIAAVEKEVETKKKEEEKLAKQLEKEEKERLAQEEEEKKEREKLAREKEEQAAKAEKERLALLQAEQKEKDKLAAEKADQLKKEEREKEKLAIAEEEQKERERLAQEEAEEKLKKPPPPVTTQVVVKKEDPPTKPKKINPPLPPVPKKPIAGIVVLHSYTVGEMGYPNLNAYGYIQFGDGTGKREITKEQFDKYAKIYH